MGCRAFSFWEGRFFRGAGLFGLDGGIWKGLVEPPCAVDKGGCFRAL
ncbi:hypothetical protein WCP94_001798 [Bilophila wadsworthia]